MYIIAKRKTTGIETRIPVASVLYWNASDPTGPVSVHLTNGEIMDLDTTLSKFDGAYRRSINTGPTDVACIA